jgi:hypothetical protein
VLRSEESAKVFWRVKLRFGKRFRDTVKQGFAGRSQGAGPGFEGRVPARYPMAVETSDLRQELEATLRNRWRIRERGYYHALRFGRFRSWSVRPRNRP